MSPYLRLRIRVDRLLAAAGLILLSPLLVVLGFRVRRHDGGPALIVVPRVGRAGRGFGMWKIRSMRVADPSGMAGGASLTSGDDDRITEVGHMLRRFHLDELPQLWNVVRGEMALFGPRPEAPVYVAPDDVRWKSVLAAPPGIAGPTQLVVGTWETEVITADEGGTAYEEKVLPVKLAIDEEYVRNASFRRDLEILAVLFARFLGRSWNPLKRRYGHLLADSIGMGGCVGTRR